MSRIRFVTMIALGTIAFCLAGVPGFSPNVAAFANEGGGDGPRPSPVAPEKPKLKKKTTAPTEKTTTSERKTRKTPAAGTRVTESSPRLPREPSIDGLPADANETRFAGDQVIVRFRLSASQASMDDVVRRLNLRHEAGRTFTLAGATMHLYTIVGGAGVRDVIAALQADPAVVTAQPNYIYELAQTETASINPAQYALMRLGIPEAHTITRGAGVAVAVIDSGIDFTHAELASSNHSELSVTGEELPLPHKHGTTIAGIIAAHGTLTGIAPDAPLIGIRAFDTTTGDEPAGTSWWIGTALDVAHKNGAGVINMSFAGPRDPLIEKSVQGSAKRGTIAIAAAGNGGPTSAPLYPAAYDDVIAVTAIDRNDALFGGANRGDYVALSAPGVDILAPAPGGGYDVSTGTSMAAAHVSGIVALVLSRKPDLSRTELLGILNNAAVDLGAPGDDPEFGSGLPDASAAIKATEI